MYVFDFGIPIECGSVVRWLDYCYLSSNFVLVHGSRIFILLFFLAILAFVKLDRFIPCFPGGQAYQMY